MVSKPTIVVPGLASSQLFGGVVGHVVRVKLSRTLGDEASTKKRFDFPSFSKTIVFLSADTVAVAGVSIFHLRVTG